MEPGAYADPMLRTTWVQVPMVSGYVGSRLRIADYAFGTSVSGASGTNVDDNKVNIQLENIANPNAVSGQTGTNIFLRFQQSNDDGPTFARTSITGEIGLVPGGKVTTAFNINAPFLEIKCTGGRGNLRAMISSRLKWEEMAYSKTDASFAPQLFNKKFVTAGVVAPAPFPTP